MSEEWKQSHLLHVDVVKHNVGVEGVCRGQMDGLGEDAHVELQIVPVLHFQRSLDALPPFGL